MPKLVIAAVCCIATLFAFSCKKPPSGHDPIVVPASKQDVFSSLKSSAQVLTVPAGQSKTIYGSQGTMLKFYPNSFKDKNGNTITSGTITIELIEMYKPGKMISNFAATVTNDDKPLQSGGEIYINATKNGEKVYANKYGIGFKQPAPSSQAMQLFFGSGKNTDSVITWSIADTSRQGTTAIATTKSDSTVGGTINTDYFIFDSCTDFTWINCDRFLGGGYTLTDVPIKISDPSLTKKDLFIYVIYPAFNSVTNVYYDFTLRNAPVGTSFKAIVFAQKDGTYYYAETTGTIATGLSVTLTTAPETLANIKSKLGEL